MVQNNGDSATKPTCFYLYVKPPGKYGDAQSYQPWPASAALIGPEIAIYSLSATARTE
jgi:hypothetical protein